MNDPETTHCDGKKRNKRPELARYQPPSSRHAQSTSSNSNNNTSLESVPANDQLTTETSTLPHTSTTEKVPNTVVNNNKQIKQQQINQSINETKKLKQPTKVENTSNTNVSKNVEKSSTPQLDINPPRQQQNTKAATKSAEQTKVSQPQQQFVEKPRKPNLEKPPLHSEQQQQSHSSNHRQNPRSVETKPKKSETPVKRSNANIKPKEEKDFPALMTIPIVEKQQQQQPFPNLERLKMVESPRRATTNGNSPTNSPQQQHSQPHTGGIIKLDKVKLDEVLMSGDKSKQQSEPVKSNKKHEWINLEMYNSDEYRTLFDPSNPDKPIYVGLKKSSNTTNNMSNGGSWQHRCLIFFSISGSSVKTNGHYF